LFYPILQCFQYFSEQLHFLLGLQNGNGEQEKGNKNRLLALKMATQMAMKSVL